MPYKDPEKRRAKSREWKKRQRKEDPETVRLQDRLRYEKERPQRIKKHAETNRKNGHQERRPGKRYRPEIIVPVSRRWAFFTAPDGVPRIYFTSKKGFELSELREIVQLFKQIQQQTLQQAAELGTLDIDPPSDPKPKRTRKSAS